jgi:type I restriction enzyme R subunit
VISDEAHRSQYGTFARNMRDALPNAGYIGFTGTPLISDEQQLTREIFGDYVSTYDFQRAVDDHATVPLYYDARGEKLEVITNEVNDRIAEKLAEVESSGEDDNTIDRLKKALGKDYGILTSEDRLDAIAQDFVEHYSTSWGIGKAMFICLDKLTCVKMYNKITHHWQQKIAELKTHHKTLTDQQAAAESDRKIAWMEQTKSKNFKTGDWISTLTVPSLTMALNWTMLITLAWDFSRTLPLALIPIPSLLIFSAKDTTFAGVLNLDIGVPVRSLNLFPHPLHK